MSRAVKPLFVILAAVGVIAIFKPQQHDDRAPDDALSSVQSVCRQPEKIEQIIAIARETGLVKSGLGTSHVEVEERLWASMPHDSKIAVALAAACRLPTAGSGVVIFRGWRDGATKASIVDGNYSDG